MRENQFCGGNRPCSAPSGTKDRPVTETIAHIEPSLTGSPLPSLLPFCA